MAATLLRERGRVAEAPLQDIYEAAINPSCWPTVLERLAAYLSAESALIRFYDEHSRAVSFSFFSGFDPRYDQQYRDYFMHIDPIREAAERYPVGRAVGLDDLLPMALLQSTEFYNDYMRPQDKHHVMGARPFSTDGITALLGLQRGRRARPFGGAELERLRIVVPHVQQALRIHQQLGAARRRAASLERLIERAGTALVLLGTDRKALFVNAAARALLRERTVLTLRNGAVRALRASVNTRLQALIGEAVHTGTGSGAGPGGGMRIDAGEDPHVLVVTPWREPGENDWLCGRPCVAAVLVGRAKTPERLRVELVARTLGLHPSEARLTVALVRHGDLESVCGELNISRNTARAYLKSIFRKTGCHRQSELMRLLLASPIPVASAIQMP